MNKIYYTYVINIIYSKVSIFFFIDRRRFYGIKYYVLFFFFLSQISKIKWILYFVVRYLVYRFDIILGF